MSNKKMLNRVVMVIILLAVVFALYKVLAPQEPHGMDEYIQLPPSAEHMNAPEEGMPMLPPPPVPAPMEEEVMAPPAPVMGEETTPLPPTTETELPGVSVPEDKASDVIREEGAAVQEVPSAPVPSPVPEAQ